jgi:hypothetical protein
MSRSGRSLLNKCVNLLLIELSVYPTHRPAGQQFFCPSCHVLHVRELFFPYYSEQVNIEFDLAPGMYDIDETQSFISIEKVPKWAVQSDVLLIESFHISSLSMSTERTNRLFSTCHEERFVRRSMKTCTSPPPTPPLKVLSIDTVVIGIE